MYRKLNTSRINLVISLSIILMMIPVTYNSSSADVLKRGAELGKWTMDIEAARELAQKHDLPIFMNFTGSDWCGWCKLMDRNIFSKTEWTKFAADNLSLVTIDFPQDPSIVPEPYKERNLSLQQQFGVTGYPTYVVLEADGKTSLGLLGASQDTNVANFKKEVSEILKYSQSHIRNYTKELAPAQASEYKNLVERLTATKSEFEGWLQSQPRESEENFQKFTQFLSTINNLTVKISVIEAEKYAKDLPADKAKEYMSLTTELNNTRIELEEWLQSRPAVNNTNQEKRDQFEHKINGLTKQIDQF